MSNNDFGNIFGFQNIVRLMDDIHESQLGIRPYGTKRVIDLNSTVEELELSEMTGLPIKIKK